MSRFRVSSSYLVSALIHGVLGYFIINTAVHVALPEGDVVEVSVGDSSAPALKGVQTQAPPPPAPAAPEPPKEIKTDEVAIVPKQLPKAKHAPTKAEPVPMPIVKEKIRDVEPDSSKESEEEEKPLPPPVPVAAPAQPEESEKMQPEEETPKSAPAPVPVPVAQGPEENGEAPESNNLPPAAAPVEAPAQTTEGVSGGTGSGPPAPYGIPSGTQIKDASLLSARPGNRPPSYPYMARLKRQQGMVVLLGYVTEKGDIEKLFLEKTSGSQLLDKEAYEAFKKWKYYPGQAGWVRKPFNFQLRD